MNNQKPNTVSPWIRFGICFLIGIGVNPVLDALSDDEVAKKPKEVAFETISEVDYSFLLTNPKLPWGNDPFQKEPGFVSMPHADEAFNLSGIVYSKNTPMAVINGKVVKEGDKISDRRVSLIGDNFVILKKHESEIELSLPPIVNDDSDEGDEEGEN